MQKVAHLTRNMSGVGSNRIKVVSLNKTFYPRCLVLVGSRNEFECEIISELK